MSRHRARQDCQTTNQDNRSKKPTRKGKQRHPKQSHKLVAPTIALTVALTGPTVLAGEKEVLTAPEVEVQEQRPGYVVPNLGLSRFPAPVRDIPQSITVVPQELMLEQGTTNIRDALRNVSRISFQAGEGGGPRETTSHCGASTPAMISFSTACATRGRTFGMCSISRPSRC